MAEAALTSIAKSSLQLFSSLAKDEFLLLWNSQEELQSLQSTIDTINSFLQDAEERKSNNVSVRKCLSRLRKSVYDAEDLFDGLAAKALRNRTIVGNKFTKEVRLFFSKSNQLGFMFKVAHQVKSLRDSLDEIIVDMEKCYLIKQLASIDQSIRRVNRNKTHYLVHEDDVIGREQDRDRMISMLLPGEDALHVSTLSVIALIGFGGWGKTTLAQLVYNDKRVEEGFEVRLWACVNYLSNLEQALIEIIASKEGKQNELGLVKLQEKLRDIIDGRKFLIVVDDLWDENRENWRSLKTILRYGKSGSKVLVTTRKKRVAECVDALEPYFDLGLLSEEHAWSLFVKRAFDSEVERKEHRGLESIGKEIVRSCGNVPLAIITIAGVLRHKGRERRIWSDFLEKKLKQVLWSDDKTQNEGCIKDVLMVSYNDLPSSLKLCFEYCSLFPKDYKFDKDELVRLWLSQGFIRSTDGNEQTLEEVGQDYFFRLVDRCFFQVVKEYKRVNYENSYCDPYRLSAKMHDLLHDMAIDVAKSESICIDEVLISNVSNISIHNERRLRHVSIHYEMGHSFTFLSKQFESRLSNPKTVRTLLLHSFPNNLSKTSLNQLLDSFKMLRVLHLPDLRVDYLSDSIGDLIHLRYLDLSYNQGLKHLPDSICKLHRLMIFVLRGCSLLEKLPPKIEQLVSLRQLFIDGCDRLDSLSGLRHLTSLVNLDRLIVNRQSGGLRYLNALHNLSGEFTIELPEEGWPDAVDDARKSDMSKKLKLNGLIIKCKRSVGGTLYEIHTGPKMAKDEAKAVLEALCPHQSLEYLKISDYAGDMLSSWVCRLNNIKELNLCKCDLEYLEDEVRFDDFLTCLKILTLTGMRKLQGWWRQEISQQTKRPCLPTVSHLTIKQCPKLKREMPLIEGLEYLSLYQVDVTLVRELLTVNHEKSSKLKELQLEDISGLFSIPEGLISHLIAIETLTINAYCRDARWVSRRGLACLTSLKNLSLSLKIGDDDDDDDKAGKEAGMPWKVLEGLVSLEINVIDKHFLQGHHYLTSLQELEINGFPPQADEDDGELQRLQFPSVPLQRLRKLTIENYDGKTSLLLLNFQAHYFPSLRRLTIRNCKESPFSWKTLLSMNLEYLTFYNVEFMVNFEEDKGLEQQSTLRTLTINRVGNWVFDIPWKSLRSLLGMRIIINKSESIPDGIQYLTSLDYLFISECNMKSLPKWFAQLSSLTLLNIEDSTQELKRRCKNQTGEDWHLISRIDEISIKTSARRSEIEEDGKREGRCLQEDGKREGCCLQGWQIFTRKKAQKFKKQKSHVDLSLDQIPEVTNEPISAPKPIVKPVPPSDPEPVVKPSRTVSLPPTPPTSEVVLAPTIMCTNLPAPQPSYDVREGRQSFIPLEYVSRFDTCDIHFSNEDVSELVNRWNLSLVGAPMGSNISYQAVQQFVSTHWIQQRNIMSPKIQQHDNGLFVFQFDKEEDLLSILRMWPWMISDQTPLILRRWQTGMPLEMSCFDQIPVWVTLPNLDVRFWSHHMLSSIGSIVGIPILTDYDPKANQEKISFPRLLVQVSARRPLLDQVRLLGVDREVVHQRLQYEWFPPQCHKCCVFGHQCIDFATEIQPASP